jgi:hypothetical protein
MSAISGFPFCVTLVPISLSRKIGKKIKMIIALAPNIYLWGWSISWNDLAETSERKEMIHHMKGDPIFRTKGNNCTINSRVCTLYQGSCRRSKRAGFVISPMLRLYEPEAVNGEGF